MTDNPASLDSRVAAPVTEVRERLSDILDEVTKLGTRMTITRHGHPIAELVATDEYESLIETLNILTDDEAMAAIREARAEVAAGNVTELEPL